MLASKMKILEPVQPKSKIRNREIRGPQIHTFGVVSKIIKQQKKLFKTQ